MLTQVDPHPGPARTGSTAPVGGYAGEHVFGPILGYFVAAYAIRTSEGFIGYGKVYRKKPQSPWEGEALMKIAGGRFQTHGSALQGVLRPAFERLRRLSG